MSMTLDDYVAQARRYPGSGLMEHFARQPALFAETESPRGRLQLGDDLEDPDGRVFRLFAIDYGRHRDDVFQVVGSYHDEPGASVEIPLRVVERHWRRRRR